MGSRMSKKLSWVLNVQPACFCFPLAANKLLGNGQGGAERIMFASWGVTSMRVDLVTAKVGLNTSCLLLGV